MSTIGTIISQLAIITALLYYFGWARSAATYGYFGIDTGTVDYDTTDYLLRSTAPVFGPLVAAIMTGIIAIYLHYYVVLRALRGRGRRRWFAERVIFSLRVVSLLVFLFVATSLLLQLSVGADLGLILPIFLAAGAAINLYCDSLVSKFFLRQPIAGKGGPVERSVARRVALYSLVFVGLFWALGLYAAGIGQEVAANLAQDVSAEPVVVLYSGQQLDIRGPGITREIATQADSKYHYVYGGLRLLVKTPNKYLLLPVGWKKGQDFVLVVPDDPSIRVDIRR